MSIVARLRAHYLISQSLCQNVLIIAKYLNISSNGCRCQKCGIVESVEELWKNSTKKCGYAFGLNPYVVEIIMIARHFFEIFFGYVI